MILKLDPIVRPLKLLSGHTMFDGDTTKGLADLALVILLQCIVSFVVGDVKSLLERRAKGAGSDALVASASTLALCRLEFLDINQNVGIVEINNNAL